MPARLVDGMERKGGGKGWGWREPERGIGSIQSYGIWILHVLLRV